MRIDMTKSLVKPNFFTNFEEQLSKCLNYKTSVCV